ncbi:MAG: beta-ketoacyl-ACP synthase II [Alphaproteobacteria bacterium]|nr:beta-ketoacyl-ACP synthase II [Alphaproteobacteria bacterium]
MKRVAVTGIGLVTPLAVGTEANWGRLLAGESGLRPMTGFDTDDLPCRVAGQVPGPEASDGLDIDALMPTRDRRRLDQFIIYAIAAADEAIRDSGWAPSEEATEARNRTGVMIGSGIGGLQSIYEASVVLEQKGPRRITPFFIPSSLINLASGQVSIRHGFRGPNHSVVTACATGMHAIGDAARMVRAGMADVMVAGGAEASVCRLGIAGFAAMRALSTHFNDSPQRASRPWDEDRDGFVMGEGAGIVVLEEFEHAQARGARVYGEIKGYGMSGDAHHISAPAPDGDGGYRSMQAALEDADMSPADIDYLNAHGTSTPLGDEIELGAIRRLFGNYAADMSISSTKSSIGHLLGAAGAVETIYALLAVVHDAVPPTLNLDRPCAGSEGLDLVPHAAKRRTVRAALSNSFGFGGTNASLIVGPAD